MQVENFFEFQELHFRAVMRALFIVSRQNRLPRFGLEKFDVLFNESRTCHQVLHTFPSPDWCIRCLSYHMQ